MSQQPPVLIKFEIVVLEAIPQIHRLANEHLLQYIFFDLTANGVNRKCSLAQNWILDGRFGGVRLLGWSRNSRF
jgi:hypothetical protein